MSITVLIAEDDRHTRNILEHIFTKDPDLKTKNINLLLASDGDQALTYFRKHKPNLIISDLLMPKMDGFAFCRAVREDPDGKDIPLIITSAVYKETPLLNTLREELNIMFFAKPFQIREFTEEIKHLLNMGSASEARQTKISRITMSGPFTGNLSNRNVAAILLDIKAIEGTGKLILEKGNIKKEIFFLFGKPIGSDSNIRHESLSNYLVGKNILTEVQNQQILIKAKQKKWSYIKSLLHSALLEEELILKYHSSLVKVRIINAFRWHEGKYSFKPGDDFSERMPKTPVEVIQLIFAGLKRVVDLDEIIKRLKSDLLSEIKLVETKKDLIPEFQRFFGSNVINEIESGTNTIGEMLGKGIKPMDVYTQIYVMLETEMITLTQSISNQTPDMNVMEDPLSLSSIKNAVNEKNDDDEISVVADIPLPSSSTDDSFVLNIPMDIGDSDNQDEDLIKDLRNLYMEIHEKDYFSILDLTPQDPPLKIQQNINKFLQKYSLENYTNIDLGNDHAKLEEINEYLKIAKTILLNPSKKREYIEKITQEQHRGEQNLNAEVLFKQAEVEIKKGNYQKASEFLQQAIKENDTEADYYALYALALFYLKENINTIMSLLKKALSLNPDSITVQKSTAAIYLSLDKKEKALEHYTKALEQYPEDEESFNRIKEILIEKNAWKILAHLHKKLLHIYKSRRPQHTERVAKSLADIYENHFNDIEQAISAWEIVLSVSPGNFEATKAIKRLKSLKMNFNKSPEEILESIRKNIIKNPYSEELLLNGFNISLSYNPDMAFIFASVLKAINTNDNETLNYYKRYSPPFLPRAWRTIDAEVWAKIADTEDSDMVGKIFETICLSISEATILDDTRKATHKIQTTNLPQKWQDILEYLSHQLGVPIPSIFKSDIQIPHLEVNNSNIVIACGEEFISQKDPKLITAYLTPLMTSYWTGRALPYLVPSRSLLLLLKAVIFYISNKTDFSVTPELSNIIKKLSRADNELKQKLITIFSEMSKHNKTNNINLNSWINGVKKSSLNAGMLLSGDFVSIYKATPSEYRQSLLLFALSTQHLEARRLLGLSIQV